MSAVSNSSKRRQSSRVAYAAGVGCSLLLIWATVVVAQQGSGEARARIARLVSQGQYDQAELQCRQSLTKSRLNAAELSSHTCDLMFVLTEKARRATEAQVESAWSDVAHVGEQYHAANEDSPRGILVELQTALASIAEAEQMLGRVQIGQEIVQDKLRGVTRQLKRMGVAVDERLRPGRKDDPNLDGYLGRKALRAIRASVRHQRAAALLMSAANVKSSDADRAYACNQAESELKAISPGDLASETWWRTRLLLARCHRLVESWAAALSVLDELEAAPSAQGLLSQVAAERLRLAIDRQQWPTIEAALGATKANDSADLALAQFEAMLLLASRKRELGNSSLAASLEARAAESLPNLEARFGSWWRRRAEKLLLASSLTANTGSKPVTGASELTAAVARSLLSEGQPLAAAAKLKDAARAAYNDDRAMAERLSLEAAAVLWEAGAWQPAKAAYLELADEFATQEKAAAAAHLMAIRCLAKLVREADGPPGSTRGSQSLSGNESAAEYGKLLEQHQVRWPGTPSAMTAGWWLAKLIEQQRDWKRAAEQCEQLLLRGNAEAGPAMVRCYREAVRDETIRPTEVVSSIRKLIHPQPTQPSSSLLIAAARLELAFATRLSVQTFEPLLRARLALAKDSTEFEQATLLLIAGSFEQPGNAPVGELLLELPETPKTHGTEASLEVAIECLDRLAGLNRPKSASVRIELIERYLGSVGMTAIQKQRLARHAAAALSDAGQVQESITAARACVQASPKDPTDQLLLANCLLASNQAADRRLAASAAEKLIAGTKPGTLFWFDAKLILAEAWIKLDQQDRASKLLRLTAALHPNWGDAKTKARYEALVARWLD